jgi:hypothetical protein
MGEIKDLDVTKARNINQGTSDDMRLLYAQRPGDVVSCKE